MGKFGKLIESVQTKRKVSHLIRKDGGKHLKRILTFIFLILIGILVGSNRELFKLLLNSDIDTIILYLKSNLLYTLLFTLLFMIIQNSFTIIPLLLLITINFALFDFLYGFLWSWVTSVIAAIIVFFAIRNWFQEIILKKVKGNNIKAKVEKNGFWYVFVGRIFPLVPTSLINMAAAVSTIKFRHFLVATLLGNFVYFFILTLIPLGLLSVNIDKLVLTSVVFLGILVLVFYKLLKKRQVNLFQRKREKH